MSDPDTTKASSPSATEAFEQALAQQDAGFYVFRLYVAGMSPRSLRAIENIQTLCAQYLPGHFELQIIDIYQQPDFAREEQIVAAPTLVKELPLPIRKFIGDLSQTEKILAGLEVQKKELP